MSPAAASSAVRLYGLERSVYTRIARLALEEKGVAYALEEVEIFGPGGVPDAHRRRHPFGRIPVLQHGAFMLYETGAITRYVDEAFPGPPLLPQGATERARVNQVIGILDAYAYRPMVWGVFVERVRKPLSGTAVDEGLVAASLETAATCLDTLEALLGAGRYFAGDAISLADLHAYPMLRYFNLAPEGALAIAQRPRLVSWLQTVGRRPSVARTASRYERTAGAASAEP